MRALVVHTGGIGDFLLACPALKQLANEYTVTLAGGNTDRLQLAVEAGIAVDAVSLNRIHFDSLFATPSKTLSEFVKRFDRIIVWMRDNDNTIRSQLGSITDAQLDIAPGLPPNDWSRHASAYFLDTLGLDGEAACLLSITPSPEPHDIIIHPGSGGKSKNWPLEHFLALKDRLQDIQRTVTWSLGPAELEYGLASQLIPALPSDSLIDLARHLAAARCYIGNDSGITHLAATVGTPTIALFGPTDPAVWVPLGTHVTVLTDAFRNPAAAQSRIRKLVSGT